MTTKTPYSVSNAPFKIRLATILETENIAKILDDEQEKRLISIVSETYQTDKAQSSKIMGEMEKYMKLTMQIIELSETTSQHYNNNIPLILKAAMNFNADAFPALTKAKDIVRFMPVGSDKDVIALDEKGEPIINQETEEEVIEMEGGEKQKKANRVQKYMNYFLRKRMTKFVSDIDRLTLTFSVTGSIYKKTFFNRYTNLPDSILVMPNNVIVNPAAEDMKNYPVSEIKFYTQNEVKQKMVTGEFKEYDIEDMSKGNQEEEDANNNDSAPDKREFAENDDVIRVIEQHCLIDLDGDGYKEPYVVTFDESQKLLAVQKRFSESSIRRLKDKIIEIEPDVYWTHYKFMPDPRGTFHGLGFGFILHKFNNTLNSCINQLLKSAYRANQERGIFDKDKINWGADVLELKDGQFRGLEVIEGSIKDAFQDFPAKEPSAGLFNLTTFLLEVGKDLASISDVLDGKFPASASPTTVLAMIQQGMREFKVVYTRLYNSLSEELEKIYIIVGEHPELYAEEYKIYLDDPEANFGEDFDSKNLDIMPAADPEIVLDSEKAVKADILQQYIGNPIINQHELIKRILILRRVEDVDELLNEPPSKNQPDPQLVLMQQQQELERRKQENEENSIKLRNAELQLKREDHVLEKQIAAGNVAKQDIEGDEIEAKIQNINANTIKTLKEAGQEASAETADALYEPKSQQAQG